MMQSHIARSLHDEHTTTLALLARLEKLLGRHGPAALPDSVDSSVASLLRALARAVTADLQPHFAFEETHLFPLLGESSATEMVALLTAEHALLLPCAQTLAARARQGESRGFDPATWAAFHAAGGALAGPLAAHIEKEEMGLLPALDDLLDPETDGKLALVLAESR